ncbi:hypothetical protein LshimejAT787_0308870 [Lyophyllum shimeji]|uniref:F-box domain-containing protein n=1 Tax=Lyophyllum shimeji TaxID=47721 RepID=A0A9P3PJI1_LYOSH|nr:hypothetical protein LshimejAT787_0308870 [Lyophyllum shimeji]
MAAAAPVNRLPAEVLSEIFILLKSTIDAEMPPYGAQFLDLTLGRVCSQWRDVAYRLTPALWKELKIDINQCSDANGCAFVQEWLARVGQKDINSN